MKYGRLCALGIIVLSVVVIAVGPAEAQRLGPQKVQTVPPTSSQPSSASSPATSTAALASTPPTLQRCQGPQRNIAPKETFNLTCNAVSPLGGNKMLILPEMWVPGNGCIVAVDKPRVVMVGNNFGVSATFTNRCGGGYMGSEGGLAWLIYQMQ